MKIILNIKLTGTVLLIMCILQVTNSFGQTCTPPPPPGPGGAGGGAGNGGANCGPGGPGGNQGPGGAGGSGGSGWVLLIISPGDPNEIISPVGFDTVRWVSINDNMGYTIRYENDPKIATAPAHNVYVYYPISPTQDITTFRLGSYGFNGDVFNVPVETSYYSTRLDLRDSLGLYVDVTAGIDVVNKRAFWIFESIDPATGLPSEDPYLGFLPVKDSTLGYSNDTLPVKGEGFMNFTIKPLSTSKTRDVIYATAQIIFDINDTIPTNIEFNTVDALAPSSTIAATPVTDNTYSLHFTSVDDNEGSGVKSFDLYVAQDTANYNLYLTNFVDSVITFTGVPGSKYYFFSLATDNTGNREAMKTMPDITLNTGAIYIVSAEYFIDADPGTGNGSSLSINAPGVKVSQNFNCPVPEGIEDGQHFLCIRIQDEQGYWSAFAIDTFTVDHALPLTGLYFTGQLKNKKTYLQWHTLTENNTSHFEIERSINGIDFTKIGSVKANGNSANQSNYSWVDDLPLKGINYYRLKQFDNDGKYSYSPIIKILVDEEQNIVIYPIPAKNIIMMKVPTNQERLIINIFDASGKWVNQQVTAAAPVITLPVNNLAAGVYWVQVSDGVKVFKGKFIKE